MSSGQGAITVWPGDQEDEYIRSNDLRVFSREQNDTDHLTRGEKQDPLYARFLAKHDIVPAGARRIKFSGGMPAGLVLLPTRADKICVMVPDMTALCDVRMRFGVMWHARVDSLTGECLIVGIAARDVEHLIGERGAAQVSFDRHEDAFRWRGACASLPERLAVQTSNGRTQHIDAIGELKNLVVV